VADRISSVDVKMAGGAPRSSTEELNSSIISGKGGIWATEIVKFPPK